MLGTARTLPASWLLLVAGVHFAGTVDTFGPLVKATAGEVWPRPQSQTKYSGYMVVRPSAFTFSVTNRTCELLEEAVRRYSAVVSSHAASSSSPATRGGAAGDDTADDPAYVGQLDSLEVQLASPCEDYPYLGMGEQYELKINSSNEKNTAVLSSETVWGIMRGLETFSQLLYLDHSTKELRVNCTEITDYPRFAHRGLLLDTARHYMPLATIKSILDGMEMNKMNVFHWHIVDSQSFPYQSEVFPDLSEKGAYDPVTHIYTHEDVKNITEHARRRGIRVMPEFDTPGHSLSWGPGQPGLLTPCYSYGGETPDGTYGPIDPTRPSTYTFIEKLFREVVALFPDRYLHLGGDEVSFDCWRSNPNISTFMRENGISGYAQLEQYYMQRVVNITDGLDASSVVWQEVFDNGVVIPASTVVHVWTGTQEYELRKVTAAGHRALLSACWYLGRLESGGDWKKYYECEPTSFYGTEEQKKLVIGGEACMWGEVVDESNVVPRVWPRASAAAEKLWSPAGADTEDGAAQRLEEHYCRMRRRGIQAQPPNGPGFCSDVPSPQQ